MCGFAGGCMWRVHVAEGVLGVAVVGRVCFR
jgi:hypothetical protein